jgi:hypothetical protein
VTAGRSNPWMESRVRAALLGIFLFGALGAAAELLLLEHTEKPWQWTPLVLIAASWIALAWHVVARSRASVRAFQALMLLFAAGGLAGMALHYRGNLEFEREMHPHGTAGELFKSAMMGATPALAPGTMILLGLIGLVYAYQHPSLGPPQGLVPTSAEE